MYMCTLTYCKAKQLKRMWSQCPIHSIIYHTNIDVPGYTCMHVNLNFSSCFSQSIFLFFVQSARFRVHCRGNDGRLRTSLQELPLVSKEALGASEEIGEDQESAS